MLTGLPPHTTAAVQYTTSHTWAMLQQTHTGQRHPSPPAAVAESARTGSSCHCSMHKPVGGQDERGVCLLLLQQQQRHAAPPVQCALFPAKTPAHAPLAPQVFDQCIMVDERIKSQHIHAHLWQQTGHFVRPIHAPEASQKTPREQTARAPSTGALRNARGGQCRP